MIEQRMKRLASLALLTPVLHVSAQYSATYDWYAHPAPAFGRVTAGQSIRLTIVNENRVCFSYAVDASLTSASDVTWADWVKGLAGAGTQLGALLKPPAPAAPAPGNPALPGAAAAQGVGGTHVDNKAAAEAELNAAFKASNDAYDAALDATKPLDALKDADDKAASALKDYPTKACGGDRGAANFVTLWTVTTKPVAAAFVTAAGAGLPGVKKDVAAAKPLLDLAKADIAVFRSKASKDAAYQAVLTAHQNDIIRNDDALATISKRLTDADAAVTTLQADAKSVTDAAAKLDAATAVTSETKTIGTNDNTASVTIKIVATGALGPATGRVITDELPLPVYRRIRSFMTAGLMFSTLREHDYERANVVDTSGKSYSTFVDRTPGSSIAFAPTVMANITLEDLGEGFDLSIAGGMALRSAADKPTVDFLIGPSITVRDIAGLTLAFHKGRVEKLLIGSPAEVRGKPVPSDVNRASGVGASWSDAIALVFSIKLQ